MNYIEKIKQLAVPVAECNDREIYELGIRSNNIICVPDGYLHCDEGKYYDSNGYEFTHVIDFSLLTTKERAIELAESTFDYGYFVASSTDMWANEKKLKQEFITEKKGKL